VSKSIQAAKLYIAGYVVDAPEAVRIKKYSQLTSQIQGDKDNTTGKIVAMKYLEKALTLDPKSREANAIAGEFISLLGDDDSALKFLEQAKALGDTEVLYTMGMMFVSKDASRAIGYLEEYLKHYPDHTAVKEIIERLKVSPNAFTEETRKFGDGMIQYLYTIREMHSKLIHPEMPKPLERSQYQNHRTLLKPRKPKAVNEPLSVNVVYWRLYGRFCRNSVEANQRFC
jgi:tetratricopeptide (TPR) repeat protein